jgi:replicative DNA helicase
MSCTFNCPNPLNLIELPEPINLHCIPDLLGEICEAIENQFQIDRAIPFGQALGMIAAATRGKVRTQVSPNWIEHSSFYVLTIAETGDGKSQVMNLLRKPLDAYELNLRADAAKDYGLRAANYEIAQANLKRIKETMSNGRKSKTPATQADLQAAIDEVENTKPADIPLLSIGGDVTPDKLADLIVQNKELAIHDAEGTLFSHLSGTRHGTGSAWETMLQAFTGDPIKVHRIGRDGGSVAGAHLIINTSVQPIVWKEIISDKNAVGRGAIGRFIVLNAQSKIGYRDPAAHQSYPIPADLIESWGGVIRALLEIKEPRIFELDAEQVQIVIDYKARLEKLLRDPDNRLDGFGSRLPGILIRIAQLFTLIDNPAATLMSTRYLECALGFGDYLMQQREQADLIKERTREMRTLDVISKLARESVGDVGDVNRAFTFSVRDVQQRGKGQTWIKEGGSKAIEAALMNLEKWGWIEADCDNWQICTCRLSMPW